MEKKVNITYCGSWGYVDKASSLEAKINTEIEGASVELVQSSGGIFTVSVNGNEIFNNKKETVKFPIEEEVIRKIQAHP